ncbi:DUF6404 family protein [Marinomonas balearica]|uniref:DUF6404 family protein n=1 Tax=Marinomonas balearica TaxID=491947 RepID=UPI00105BD39C|nr:DUF6404 family protein [Marinomonas balearica]
MSSEKSSENTSFEVRLQMAHDELEKRGVWRSNYNPPIYSLLRRLGIKLPPPYFLSFHANVIVNFVYMLALASIIFAFTQGGFDASVFDKTLLWSIAYSIFMAVFYLWRRTQLKLGAWKNIG